MWLLYFAAASADLERLDQAVARCDRGFANPAFSNESARRSRFLLDAYREQEAIVTARLDIAQGRRALREAGGKKAAPDDKKMVEEHVGEIAFPDRPGGGTHVRISFDVEHLAAMETEEGESHAAAAAAQGDEQDESGSGVTDGA